MVELRGDLHRGVALAGGGSPDQQRHRRSLLLHGGGNLDHLVQRRGDQPRQPDQIGALADGRFENLLGRHHHAQIDHVEVVAPQNNPDNVLADVVDIAPDSGRDNPPPRLTRHPVRLLFLFHERGQVGDRLFHHPGTLDHLRQEHPTRSEQFADGVHPRHQRPLDDFQRTIVLLPGLLGIVDNVLVDAFDQGMSQPVFNRSVAPLGHLRLAAVDIGPDRFGQRQQPIGRILASVPQDVFDMLEQLGGNVVVDGQLGRVDDPQLHAGFDGVIEEGRVHGAANLFVAAESERDVADPTGDQRTGTGLADPPRGVEERHGIIVVFAHPRSHRQDVGIEDDVTRSKTDLLGQQPERATGNLELPLRDGRLPGLVETHHDHCRTVTMDQASLFQE